MADNNTNNTEETRPMNMTPYSDSPLADVVALVKDGSGKYTPGRTGGQPGENVITNVTLHIVATDWDANSLAGWSRWGQASSNYGIASDGTIVQLVNEKDTPWTNGGSDNIRLPNPVGSGTVGYNTNSVTIEISNLIAPGSGEGTFVASNGQEYHYKDGKVEMNGQYYTYPITNEALDSTIRLVADIAKRNNLGDLYHDGYNGTLTWHRDFPNVYKPCPGDYVVAMTDYIMESANMINKYGYYIPDYSITSEYGSGLMAVVLETENPFEEGTVASDMYLTVSSINNIRNSIGNIDAQTPVCESTSTIPSNFTNAENSLLGISNDLNQNIYNETKVIASIAQVFFDMDRERTAAASQLSDGSEVTFDDSAYTDVLNQLVSTDITADISFDSFMFSPSSHVEGNSGKICLSDINSMLSGGSLTGPLHDNLENERTNARNIQKEIDNLNSLILSSTNFQGDIWKQVGNRLTEYSELMTTRIEAADILEKAMVDALTLIKDYMGEYEELDDSKLPELRERVQQIKQSIIESQNIIDATHTVTKTTTDDRGGTIYYYVTEYVYSASARQAAKEYITQATTLLREIEKEIVKLEGLPIILAQAEQIVNDALSEIYNKYGVKVSNVVTGNEVSYIPPANTTYTASALPKHEPWTYNKDIPEGKLNIGEFYMRPELVKEYGSYDDYLNGVKKENNPVYNEDMVDNGIEPGEDPNAQPEDTEPEVPEDTTPEDTEDPDLDTPSEEDKPDEPEEPDTPGQPSNPDVPSEPSEPDVPSEPSEPDVPSEPSEPDVPSEPSEPDVPSEPSEPDVPSEPSEPDVPSEPSEPDVPSEPSEPDVPSEPSEPDVPSEPSEPDVPSEPSKPDVPSEPSKPDVPSETPKPDIPSQSPQPDVPSEPDSSIIPEDGQPEYPNDSIIPEDGDLAIDDNINNDLPPIIEIPDDNNNNNNDIIDITPPGNENIDTDNGENSGNLIKTVGIISGVGAAVGAAALGAHVVKNAKDKNYDEDDDN